MNCPECGAGPFVLTAGEAPPEPTPADVEIARVEAASSERRMLIERGINPETMRPLDGAEGAVEIAEVHAEAVVEVAEAEASAEVAAAEVVGDAIEGAAEVVAAATEAAAEIVTSDESNGELDDEVEVVIEGGAEEDAEALSSGSRASRWGFR